MSNPFAGAGFGGGLPGSLWDAMEQMRSSVDKRVGFRVGRGDVRAAVLLLLAEQPMHGYQIISEIAERSGGAWKPSAGSVYPTLQLLADEGLIVAEEAGGRKTYSLTDAGAAEAEEAAESDAPWEAPGMRDSGRMTALPKAGMELAQVVAQVARTGSPEQVQAAVDALGETRRRLYAILAED
ncbi:PadR family transcriptional regulator [Microbacterium sp. CIAB417]|uniref:PadR family transcriptional regulator n=1 Tax=Microbacterium sp. CIAB417 TaxID=2860287 RepID=UPI001FADEE30|nr:PadR family transcriptional regulator [Microbacterium sp. CIAB417]